MLTYLQIRAFLTYISRRLDSKILDTLLSLYKFYTYDKNIQINESKGRLTLKFGFLTDEKEVFNKNISTDIVELIRNEYPNLIDKVEIQTLDDLTPDPDYSYVTEKMSGVNIELYIDVTDDRYALVNGMLLLNGKQCLDECK